MYRRLKKYSKKTKLNVYTEKKYQRNTKTGMQGKIKGIIL